MAVVVENEEFSVSRTIELLRNFPQCGRVEMRDGVIGVRCAEDGRCADIGAPSIWYPITTDAVDLPWQWR